MIKNDKRKLFEVFEKVNNINLKEWYDDDYRNAPNQPQDIGDFNAIDWQALHEQLILNTKIIKLNRNSTEKDLASSVDDLINSDGMLNLEELQHLENFGLINMNGVFSNLIGQYPIIENKKYFDFNTFKTKAAEIWHKAPVQQNQKVNNEGF